MSLPPRRLAGLAVAAAGALVLSGCGGGSPATTAGGDHAVPSVSASPTVTPVASPVPATSARATVPPPSSPPQSSATVTAWPVTSPPSGGGHCLSGTVDIGYPGSDNPLRSVCVHVGTRIHVVLHAQPGAPWRAVVSSAPPVVTVVGDGIAAGSVDATAQAVGPGTAVLSASTRAGVDPGGPATRRWQLTVTVVA